MKKTTVIVIVAILAGIFLHFRNLDNAVYLSEDEARAFALMNSGPLIYLICAPALAVTERESTAFYVAAALGLACILLFFALCRLLFGETLAAYAVLCYAVFPYRINYSRMLYPPVFIDFFVLLLLVSFWYSILKRKPAVMALAGVFSAALLYVHPFSYSILFGLLVASLFLWSAQKERMRPREAFRFVGFYTIGFFFGYLLLERILLMIDPAYAYTAYLFQFGQHEKEAIRSSTNNLIPFFITLWNIVTFSMMDILRALCVVSALAVTAVLAFRRRDVRVMFLIILACAAVSIFMCMTMLRFHEIRDRHFIWLCPLLSVCLAYTVLQMRKKKQAAVRSVVAACGLFFLGTSVFYSYRVTEETFKTVHIQKWLADNHIRKSEVVTCLHLAAPGDREVVSLPPVKEHPSWTITNQKFQIIWPLIWRAYNMGTIKYIIPSGVSSNANLADGDPMLAHVKPVQSWIHPYSAFKYRFFDNRPKKGDPIRWINVYRLNDVFSAGNLYTITSKRK
jgi:hypothetical protein